MPCGNTAGTTKTVMQGSSMQSSATELNSLLRPRHFLHYNSVTQIGGIPRERKASLYMDFDSSFNRSHERRRYDAQIIFSHQKKTYNGSIKNISIGGAFIATSSVNQFYSGDVVILSIPFTDGRKSLKRRGRIQWLNNEGFAIEFI